MSFRPHMYVQKKGVILLDFYCRNYSEWDLFLTALEVLRETKEITGLSGIMERYSPTEVITMSDLDICELPVLVDLTTSAIYIIRRLWSPTIGSSEYRLLKSEEVDRLKVIDLKTVIERAQDRELYEASVFSAGEKIPFEKANLFDYLSGIDLKTRKAFFDTIKPNIFSDVYKASLVNTPVEEQRTKTKALLEMVNDTLQFEEEENGKIMKIACFLEEKLWTQMI